MNDADVIILVVGAVLFLVVFCMPTTEDDQK